MQDIKKKNTKLCRLCNSTKHGNINHKLYKVWQKQRERCNNKNYIRYDRYGGRGILFSSEFNDFNIWLEYIESLPLIDDKNPTLDRINNDGNYEKFNLRWASYNTQARNKCKLQLNNKSGYKRVNYNKKDKKYYAYIKVNCKQIQLGRFDFPWTAAYAYDSYVIKNDLEHTKNF